MAHHSRTRSPAPAVSIGRSRPRESPGPDSAFDPLYLLIPGDGSRSSGRAASAALVAARRFAAGRPVVLLDLDPAGGHLQNLVGQRDGEGLAEALEFGLSLQAAGFPIEPNVRFVPSGRLPASGVGALFEHAGWQRLLDGARRRGIRLLAYVPSDENLPGLAALASAALLLATPDEELKLHARLPEGLRIVGTIEPPSTPSPQSAASGGSEALHPPSDRGTTGPDTDTTRESLPGNVPVVANQSAGQLRSVAPSSGDGSFASVFKALTADLEAPDSKADRSRADSPYHPPKDSTQTPSYESAPAEARRRKRGPENGPTVDEGSYAAFTAAPSEIVAPPPPPTARGLTLPEWLEEAEARIEMLREPSRSLVRPSLRLDPGPAEPGDARGNDSFLAALETVEARLAAAEAGGTDRSIETALPERDIGAAMATVPGASSASGRRTSPGRERFVRVAAVGILAYWTLYIVWRWGFTLNPEALWFSIPVALAETWAWMSAILVCVIVWRLNHRPSPVAPPPDLSVDVFVIARDEPLEVIRRTTASASTLRYPHRTWIVDAVGRAEIQAMAGELGTGDLDTGYLAPAEGDRSLAAALNRAMEATNGQFVLTLDADHAILPDTLDTLLGYLDDPRVAFVQTPPDVSEVDPLGFGMDDETHRIREERRLAASLLQPGRDAHDCSILSPGCALLRRSALAEVGGFSGNAGAETIETSLRLHAAGWKSAYIAESFTYGLGGRSAASRNGQREERTRGAMRTFRRHNPVTTPGLKLAERFSYFHALTEPVAGAQKLIFYLTPAIFFCTGLLPVRALDAGFLALFIPYLLLSVVYYEVLSRGLVHTWLAQRSQMTTFWSYAKALVTSMGGGTRRPSRERQESADEGLRAFRPQLILVFVIALSIGWGAWAMTNGWIDYAGGWASLAVQLNLGWAACTIILALLVIRRGLRLQRLGHGRRFWPHFAIDVEPVLEGVVTEPQLVVMEDLGAGGLSFRCASRFPAGAELSFDLPLHTGDLRIRGGVTQVRQELGLPAFVHKVEFRDLPPDAREAIESFCRQTGAETGVRGGGRVSENPERQSGSTGGRKIRLPAWVMVGAGLEKPQSPGAESHIAVLEEQAPGGASLILRDAIEPGTPVIYEVPGSNLRGEGSIIYSRMLETPLGIRFRVGIRTPGEDTPGRPNSDAT